MRPWRRKSASVTGIGGMISSPQDIHRLWETPVLTPICWGPRMGWLPDGNGDRRPAADSYPRPHPGDVRRVPDLLLAVYAAADLGGYRVGKDHRREDEDVHLRQAEERPFLAAHPGLLHLCRQRAVAVRQPPAGPPQPWHHLPPAVATLLRLQGSRFPVRRPGNLGTSGTARGIPRLHAPRRRAVRPGAQSRRSRRGRPLSAAQCGVAELD